MCLLWKWLKSVRSVLGAHGKSPSKKLYLETSALEIKHSIAVRRLSYLQTILNRPEQEIVYDIWDICQIYTAQKKSPCKGDWVLLAKEDQTKYRVDIGDDFNKNVRKYALNELDY